MTSRRSTLLRGLLLALILVLDACSSVRPPPDPTPTADAAIAPYVSGTIGCAITEEGTIGNFRVQVVVHSTSPGSSGSLALITRGEEKPVPHFSGAQLEADLGASNGAIKGCGGPQARAIRLDIESRMVTPSGWLMVLAASPVNVEITDEASRPLVTPIAVTPGQPDQTVSWTGK